MTIWRVTRLTLLRSVRARSAEGKAAWAETGRKLIRDDNQLRSGGLESGLTSWIMAPCASLSGALDRSLAVNAELSPLERPAGQLVEMA